MSSAARARLRVSLDRAMRVEVVGVVVAVVGISDAASDVGGTGGRACAGVSEGVRAP